MKALVLISFIILAACSSQKIVQRHQSPKINANDSTQYELLVFDNGFESWYALRNSPAQAHNIAYYHDWNIQYVNEWNYRATTFRHSDIFGQPIDYHASEDYPYEIEHKLFYYFQYVEQILGIHLLRNGPKTI